MDYNSKPPADPHFRPPPQSLPPTMNNGAPPAPPAAENDFSFAVERVLSYAEQRQSSPPLSSQELSTLSTLCQVQASRKGGIADDLGFADVDPDMTGQLVELLEKHVAMASSIELNKEAYTIFRKSKNKEIDLTVDQVRFFRYNTTESLFCLCHILTIRMNLCLFIFYSGLPVLVSL